MLQDATKVNYREFDDALLALDSRYSFLPDETNYYNVHRPKSLILALQHRIEKFDPAVIAPIFKEYMDESVESYQILTAAGTGHVITLVKTASGRELVLRTNMLLSAPELYMELEFDFIKCFNRLGIPTTPLYIANVSRTKYPFDLQIMAKLPGKDLGAEWVGSQGDYESICREQGRYFARLATVPGKGWGRIRRDEQGNLFGIRNSLLEHLTAYLDHDLEVATLFGVLSKDEAAEVSEFFASSQLIELFKDTTPHFIHNDPSDLNMRYEGEHLVSVFDWEHAIMFDPVSELGIAPTWKSAYPKKEMLIKGFIDELGHTPDNFEEKMNMYFLRKMLDKVAFALKGERLSQRHVDLLRKGLISCKLILN